MPLISCHAKTNQGPFLNLNEDNYSLNFDENLFMVLDAFGGSGIGDKGIKEVEENVSKFFQNITSDPEATQPFFFNPQYTIETNGLINALTYTHKLLLKKNQNKPLDERVGVSGGFLVYEDFLINIVNIGTTKAYLYRDENLQVLASDHRLNSFQKDDILSIPYSALGLIENLHYDIKSLRVVDGDKIILMSDGVYSYLNDQELENLFKSDDKPSEMIENLFQLANNNGNKDNQTVLILEF